MQPSISELINSVERALEAHIMANKHLQSRLDCAEDEACFVARQKVKEACDELRILAGLKHAEHAAGNNP